ncbi:MAG: acetylglutamate kinase [Dehalococcoidia bacterium]|jgi:acetylglutamate kinase
MSRPLVIKIGGSTLGDADTTFRDVAELAKRGDIPVVVHGGGAEASRWLESMNIPSRFERGLRVTDERVLPVVVAVFAGLVNKRIVAAINGNGASAVGFCGADGRVLECRIADPELGFVGEPVTVNTAAINALRDAGIIPVIGPIGCVPGEGADQLVNINADTVAGNIAAALQARQLVFLTDIDGVRGSDGNVIPALAPSRARELIADGTISGGMIPKVEACLHAAGLGVAVQIVDGRSSGMLLATEGAGTAFTPA